jgi:hypothetical protein
MVAEGAEHVAVDCSAVIAAFAPIDIVESIERMEFGVDDEERRLLHAITTERRALEVLNSPAMTTPPPMWVDGYRLALEAADIDSSADRTRLTLTWGPHA